MEGIFISYRRDDSAGYAGRLYDRLAAHFGPDNVFMDVEGIEPGTDFVKAIEGAVASCKVLIVLIGDQWLSATDASGRRRLDDPHDFIRIETSTALQRDIRVVPVLVDRAAMPAQAELPDDLQSLVRRQAVELNHKQWEATSGELIKTLEKILNTIEGRPISSAKPEETSNKSSPARPGGMLWIAIAALLVIVAGTAFWRFSPVDDNHSPAPSLTGKDEPGEPKLRMVQQPFTLPEKVVTASPRPERIETEKAAVAVTAGKELKSAEPVAEPAAVNRSEVDESTPARESPAIATDPEPIPEKRPEVVDPAPVRESPAVATDTAPIQEKRPQIVDPAPVRTKPTVAPAPTPIPVKPVQAKPEQPPVITSMTMQTGKTSVSVCYQAVRAQQLRLLPMPGNLNNHVKDCVNVAVEKPTLFTLSATGPGGRSSRQITVSPHPDTVAEIEQRSKLPGKGEQWVYQTRGKWPTSPRHKFQISIDRADNSMVSETMLVLEPVKKATGSRNSNGGNPGFLSWPNIGLEFSPWMGAYIELSGKESWEDIATPDVGSWDRWKSNATTSKRERVEVPAGSFDAWKVEVWSNRNATGGSTLAGQEPVRIQFLVWYAPQIKRYVKSIRKIISASGQVQEEDLFELTEYTPR